MIQFPEGLYADVRIEETATTLIEIKDGHLNEQKVRRNKGAFLRVFDGRLWYYKATTDIDNLQASLDALAKMASPTAKENLSDHPAIKMLEQHQNTLLQYANASYADVPVADKLALLKDVLAGLDHPTIQSITGTYSDTYTQKWLYSSKGMDLHFDWQAGGIRIGTELASGENKDRFSASKAANSFEALQAVKGYLHQEVQKNIDFIEGARPVAPGVYTVLLSPLAAGVFTHESFGHKSESDFMVGDETMKREWALGKKVGSGILTIVDDGNETGSGFVPFDDEGTRAPKTYLVKNGVLAGRLHNAYTSAVLEEGLTGNARALNFEFEPIVRMTTTYIERGNRPLAEMLSEIENGIYVETIKHGSGMSTFTIAPARAYRIEGGVITDPINVSVVTGNVFETLNEVDAVSQEFELLSFVGGGCGKMEQWPLPVGFGGPYTRVKKLNVQ